MQISLLYEHWASILYRFLFVCFALRGIKFVSYLVRWSVFFAIILSSFANFGRNLFVFMIIITVYKELYIGETLIRFIYSIFSVPIFTSLYRFIYLFLKHSLFPPLSLYLSISLSLSLSLSIYLSYLSVYFLFITSNLCYYWM